MKLEYPLKFPHQWYEEYLDRGDGALLGGGDPLLHAAHVGGQGGLVAHSGGNTAQKGRHLGTSLQGQAFYAAVTYYYTDIP